MPDATLKETRYEVTGDAIGLGHPAATAAVEAVFADLGGHGGRSSGEAVVILVVLAKLGILKRGRADSLRPVGPTGPLMLQLGAARSSRAERINVRATHVDPAARRQLREALTGLLTGVATGVAVRAVIQEVNSGAK